MLLGFANDIDKQALDFFVEDAMESFILYFLNMNVWWGKLAIHSIMVDIQWNLIMNDDYYHVKILMCYTNLDEHYEKIDMFYKGTILALLLNVAMV